MASIYNWPVDKASQEAHQKPTIQVFASLSILTGILKSFLRWYAHECVGINISILIND